MQFRRFKTFIGLFLSFLNRQGAKSAKVCANRVSAGKDGRLRFAQSLQPAAHLLGCRSNPSWAILNIFGDVLNMARRSRIDTPGILQHVIVRGIERRRIFKGDADKLSFIDRLANLIPETQTKCYAWVLMDNHAHLLLRSGPAGLALLMRRLLTGHAVYFNRRYRRHGQLFQNRYKSIICQEDTYLKELVRYIHLNPLRAKMFDGLPSLNRYPHCGHSVLLGNRICDWQDTEYILSCFGDSLKAARKQYRAFVKAGVTQGRRPDLVGGGLIRSL